MTLTLDVSEELESKLEAEAKRKGLSTDEYIRSILEEKLDVEKARPNFTSKIIATDLPVRDFSLEEKWLAENRDEYDGKYVALKGDKLIAVAENYKEASNFARKGGIKNALIVFVEGRNRPPFISGGLWRE